MLAVKLALPVRPPLFLARERLRQQLAHWAQYRAILVWAPAGYGKSMVAADFLDRLAGEPVRLAWLSLDEADDDPARFVAALAAALAISQEGGGGHIPPLQLLLQLLDRLIAQGTTVMLALDDLHRLKNPAVHKLLAFAIERSPAFLHWFLLSRHKPALGLSRLRLRKQVLEIEQQRSAAGTGRAGTVPAPGWPGQTGDGFDRPAGKTHAGVACRGTSGFAFAA